MPATLQLPNDYYAPGKAAEVARYAFELAAPSIENVATELVATVAFGILLSRYNGQSEIALDLRKQPRELSLRLETPPEATPRDLLESAGEQLQEDIVELAREPGTREAAVSWLDVEPTNLPLRGASINLAIYKSASGQRASLAYDSNQFKASTIRRIAGHLNELLAHLPGQLDAPISTLQLLAAPEKDQIEAACNGAVRALGPGYAHQLFERHAANQPEAIALRFRDQTLTYKELNERANRLARALLARGVSRESRVMVCVEPSFDIAIALLAILKAGGVYVPLDPTYPAARIETLLAETKPALLLARRELAERLNLHTTPLLALDEDVASDGENLATPIESEQTAYIYFTSGTTGLPKGAMGSQGNLRHYLRSAQDRYDLGHADVMPAVARFTFSISMFELMSPLVSGGTLLILEREHVLDPPRLAKTLREVTIFHIGPSLLRSLLAYIEKHVADFSEFSKVRHASSGGDMVPPEILESLKRIFTSAEVFVIYGCTEVSCMGCTWPVTRARRIEQTFVGRPFDNTRLCILDPMQNLMPVGVVGEICFAGDGVIKGYLNRPDLTAEKFFVRDGRRYYRTGDIGRLTEDGWVQLIGRRDFQVQLRGMRIELGEVEHHLRRAPDVKEGVVVARENGEGEKNLVAYFVAAAQASGSTQTMQVKLAIRQHLREQLPEYMVPSIYVELERLPLNLNLKLDRKSLPEPKASDRRLEVVAAEEEFREPRSKTEKHLARLWCGLLELEKASLSDHFFDAGGDSLLAIELILKVDAELGVLLDGLEIVRESLGTLAELCDQRRGLCKDPLEEAPAPRVEPLELLHFGPENSLYGVLHKAQLAGESHAALICGPLGPEATRTHFVLQRLARQLAAHGIATLRFDYFGTGDSLGESARGGCRRWEEDIYSAYIELQKQSQAKRVTVIGVRSGAALLAQLWNRIDAGKIVLWDPVCDGGAYVQELIDEHDRYLKNVRYRRRWQGTPQAKGALDLAGMTYSTDALEQLRQLSLAAQPISRGRSLCWLESAESPERRRLFELLARGDKRSRLERIELTPGWSEIERIEHTLADAGISKRLLNMVLE